MIRLLASVLKPYKYHVLAVICLQLVQSLAALFLPALNATIIDDGVSQGDTGTIWYYGGIMLVVSLIQITAQIAAIWFGAKTAMSVGRDLRERLFEHGISLSSREISSFGAPTLITRNTNDVQQVQMLVLMTATMIVSAPLTMFGGVIMALREDVGLSWLILVAVIALAAIIGIVVAQVTPLLQVQQLRIDNINRVLREQISGTRVIRAFIREPYEAKRFDKANHELTDTATRVGTRMAAMFPSVFVILNLSSVAIVWFGAYRISGGDMQVGQLMAYLAYVAQILMSVMMATMMLMIAPRAAVSSKRILEVLDTESSIVDPQTPKTNSLDPRQVDFKNASFSYPGAEEPVIKNINFTVLPGSTTAIIGSTGSGKSTLVKLIPRLFDTTGGEVLIGGLDVREWNPDDLWDKVGLVPQKAYLFNGTVANNLRLGNPYASDEDLWAALEVAQASNFVRAMPDGLNSPITQGGTNVSGGQLQRLTIARALVSKPAILIFDDSFSALDVVTDRALRQAIAKLNADMSVIMVAQRVATLRHAEQIVVLDAGEIVGIGNHEELLESCQTYLEIVESQIDSESETI